MLPGFPPEQAASLKQALIGVTETLAAKAKPGARPQRWPMLEWRLRDAQAAAAAESCGSELEQLEVICNPNAHTSVFDARALITMTTRGGLKLTTEARLPTLQADVDAYLSATISPTAAEQQR
jgi:hypothetical protein